MKRIIAIAAVVLVIFVFGIIITLSSDQRALPLYHFSIVERKLLEVNEYPDSSWKIKGFTDLILSRKAFATSQSVPIWTNTYPVYELRHEPMLSAHQGFCAMDLSNKVAICYKEGPILYAEHISHPAHKPRERFWLARDSGAESTTWTNAFFAYDTNSIPKLTAISNRGGRLSWQLTNSLLVLNPRDCAPTNLIAFAWQDWCVVSFQSNRWSVILKNTDLPADLSRNPK